MPYDRNEESSVAVKSHLPARVQDTFWESFKSAWRSYGQSQPLEHEEIAFRLAWEVVKRRY